MNRKHNLSTVCISTTIAAASGVAATAAARFDKALAWAKDRTILQIDFKRSTRYEDVIDEIYRQTSGQPFLANRFAQLLTEEANIPLTETVTMGHFETAHKKLLRSRNTHIVHLTTNIRRDRRFE